MKHRGKELLTTEFRCFANYPRLTRSRCSNTDPLIYLHLRLSISPFLSYPPPLGRQDLSLPRYPARAPARRRLLVHLFRAHRCIAPRHEKRSLVKDLSRTVTPLSGYYRSARWNRCDSCISWSRRSRFSDSPLPAKNEKWWLTGSRAGTTTGSLKYLLRVFPFFFFCRPPRGFNCVEREVIRIILFR